MNTLSRRAFLATTAAAIATFTNAPAALASTAKASQQTQKLFDDMIKATKISNADQRTDAFKRILGKYGSPSAMALYALGTIRRVVTNTKEQARFTPVFQTYLAKKYGKNLAKMGVQSLEITGAEEKSRRGQIYYIVTGNIMTTKYGKVSASFFLDKRGGKLKFYDIHIEHLGMLRAERDEMGDLFDKSKRNYEKFLAAVASK